VVQQKRRGQSLALESRVQSVGAGIITQQLTTAAKKPQVLCRARVRVGSKSSKTLRCRLSPQGQRIIAKGTQKVNLRTDLKLTKGATITTSKTLSLVESR
jgi:hypothetical protein